VTSEAVITAVEYDSERLGGEIVVTVVTLVVATSDPIVSVQEITGPMATTVTRVKVMVGDAFPEVRVRVIKPKARMITNTTMPATKTVDLFKLGSPLASTSI